MREGWLEGGKEEGEVGRVLVGVGEGGTRTEGERRKGSLPNEEKREEEEERVGGVEGVVGEEGESCLRASCRSCSKN